MWRRFDKVGCSLGANSIHIMNHGIRSVVVGLAVMTMATITVIPFASGAEFFEGKTIRIVSGGGAGGGLDAYSRIVARHIGKHIQGNPTVIVQNMPGAGSMIAANHVYRAAAPDGLTIGNFIGTVLFGQLLGRPGIEFDARHFEYVGVPVKFGNVCAFTKRSGVTSMEKWMASTKPVKVGATGPGAGIFDVPKILADALALPVQVISGYKSIGDIRLAAESGEVDGICGVGWESLKPIWAKALETGDAVVVLQMLPQAHPELPKVPLAINFAKSESARQLIKVGTQDTGALLFVYALPPGTPKERVRVLRGAFQDSLKDPALLAEANKAKLDINPLGGAEVEGLVNGLFSLNPAVVTKLKEILKDPVK
jgi:tripartite-type tricarboxylate transporter receptor subunit TctC